jgi:hypothetical protein
VVKRLEREFRVFAKMSSPRQVELNCIIARVIVFVPLSLIAVLILVALMGLCRCTPPS